MRGGTEQVFSIAFDEFSARLDHDLEELLQEAADKGGAAATPTPYKGGFRVVMPVRQRDSGL